MAEIFGEGQVRAIAQALGETDNGLTNFEIAELLQLCRISDDFAGQTKWKRIYYSLWNKQCADRDRAACLAFIRKAMKPERYLGNKFRFETVRAQLNHALMFAGLELGNDGMLRKVERVATLDEAEERAAGLKTSLELRNVHPDVLRFCRAELLADNYFHAVLEAAKSVFDKIRVLSGITGDGATLVDEVFAISSPVLAINMLSSESEKSEQSGFANLIKGIAGMFRNTTAHEARVKWKMEKTDAEDLLTMVSLIHRRLDSSRKVR